MNASSSNVEQWSAVVDQFINSHAKSLQPDEKDDLRQDIFVALIEGYGSSFDRCTELWANLTARAVLDNFRSERRSRSGLPNWGPYDVENLVPDPSSPNLDLQIDLKRALEQLPNGLRNVALDLFYHDLSQKEVADKYRRTQPWVAAARKKIANRLYSFLKEKPCQ